MEFLGTDYGGWVVDLSLIPEQSTIISAGIGEDISFDTALISRRGCNIIGVDPTPKSHAYIENYAGLNNFTLIKRALDNVPDDLIMMYKNTNPNYVSESFLPNHSSVSQLEYYYAETVTLSELFEQYEDVSVLKMDIEGSEYKVLQNLQAVPKSIRQMCVEFHHFCTDYTMEDTQKAIEHLHSLGFEKYVQNKPNAWAELTFMR
jgi:FkbM family methyltransferase